MTQLDYTWQDKALDKKDRAYFKAEFAKIGIEII